VPAICAASGITAAQEEAIRTALNHKDAAQVAKAGGAVSGLLNSLLRAAGPAKAALASLAPIALPRAAADEWARLVDVVALLETRTPALRITVDPVEFRGFEYDTGISFSFFARAGRAELGRGGRYVAGNGKPEPATGFTLYTDTVLAVMPAPTPAKRIFLPADTAADMGRSLRAGGWVTVAALGVVADVAAEARRLGCFHALIGGKIVDLS
jgi:ATP phosphoribosyltransferase regulatory subunit